MVTVQRTRDFMRPCKAIIFICSLVMIFGCEDETRPGFEPYQPEGLDMGETGLDRSMVNDALIDQRLDEAMPTPMPDQSIVPPMMPDRGLLDMAMIECEPNEILGCADVRSLSVCDESGNSASSEQCAEGERCESGMCIESICVLGELICLDENTIGSCRRDESGFIPVRTCASNSPCIDGRCESPCNPIGKVPSNVGCEYWSVDLDNYPDQFSGFPDAVPHAVVISNTSDLPAMVTVEGPEGVPLVNPQFTVNAGDLSVFTFPRLDIDGTGIFDRAFKINATQPVIAYQFNPLNNEGVASNDASLLLPTEGLGKDYIGVAWPTGTIPCFDPNNCPPHQSGYLTIIATSPGSTAMRITPKVAVVGGGIIPDLEAGIEYDFTLSEGEVLSLQAKATDLSTLLMPCMSNNDCGDLSCDFGVCLSPQTSTDLTGTLINATQPIAVFGGHEEAVVGSGMAMGAGQESACCAEHLEQQLLPISSWGTHYLAARSEPRGGSSEVWRIVAHADGTNVSTTLPMHATFTLNRGEYYEITTPDSFEVTASNSVMVAQYLVSQTATSDNVGDPALIIVPPTNQLRSDYQIITPSGYRSNWLTVTRTAGERVSLDGADLPNTLFSSFGTGQYEYAWVEVEEGVHTLEGESAFALIVYGYSSAVSYGYPGGLNLTSDTP